MSSAPRIVHRFEMALTRDDFLRLLPFAVGPRRRQTGDGNEGLEGHTDGVEWSLRLAEASHRRVASLTLPVLHVTLECSSPDSDKANRFVERFMRAYQRAGG